MPSVKLVEGPESRNRRQWSRYTPDHEIVLTLIAEDKVQFCTIQDISLGGVKLRSEKSLERGASVELHHPETGPIDGHCVWNAPGALGVEFGFSERTLDLVFHCVTTVTSPTRAAARHTVR